VLTHNNYGLPWGVSGWTMPTILARNDSDRVTALRQRVITQLKTTFASRYSRTKYLIKPCA
jgi:NADPH2:quinone reductase